MRVAIFGRTRWLIDAADALYATGHTIVVVATARAEDYYRCRVDDFASLADRTGAVFLGLVSLSDPTIQARIASSDANIAVSVNWPTLINAEVINLFPHGIINAHCGDLPRYRGNACPNWAILNGEDRVGLCVHMMDSEQVDVGPVLLRTYFPISLDTYITDIYRWLDQSIPSLLAKAVDDLEQLKIVPQPQPADPAITLRCYPRRPEDARIDWSFSVELVHRLVRASSRPFGGAFTELDDGRLLTVWRASPYTHPNQFCAVPGQVLLRDGGDPVIACGKGALRLEEVEVRGLSPEASKAIVMRSARARLH